MVTNSKEYSLKYYYKTKEKKGGVYCDVCKKEFNHLYFKRHLNSKKHKAIKDGLKLSEEDKLKEELKKIQEKLSSITEKNL